jgi:hypothetical protein
MSHFGLFWNDAAAVSTFRLSLKADDYVLEQDSGFHAPDFALQRIFSGGLEGIDIASTSCNLDISVECADYGVQLVQSCNILVVEMFLPPCTFRENVALLDMKPILVVCSNLRCSIEFLSINGGYKSMQEEYF